MPINRLLAAVLLAAPAPAAAAAQPALDAKVDSLVRAEMAKRLIPGAAVAVVKDGRIVKQATYGLANVELNVPATGATLFQIASATKSVTAVAIMRLAEAGKFKLDDRVVDRLPGLPVTWGEVTIRQLLGHLSGLPDVILDAETGVWLPGSIDSVLKQLAAMPLKPAGAAWSYNQTNYMLLGMLIERYGGMPYRDYLRHQVLEPLGVSGAVFGDSRTVVANRTSEYTRLHIDPKASRLTDLHALAYQYPDFLYTAAGIFLTAGDAARWLLGIAAGAMLRPESFQEMTTRPPLKDGKPASLGDPTMGYALGWIVSATPVHRWFGGSGGGRTAILYYPDDKLGVAVLTNLQGAGPESLAAAVAEVYLGGR